MSNGGNDGLMINLGLVLRSQSLSPAKINRHLSLDDGRHAFQLTEHATGHHFFVFSASHAPINRDLLSFPEKVCTEESLLNAANVCAAMGNPLIASLILLTQGR